MMSSLERYLATIAFEKLDRPLYVECGYWAATVRRWYSEGLPEHQGVPQDLPNGRSVSGDTALDVESAMGFDPFYRRLTVNTGLYPLFEEILLEDHGEWILQQNNQGGIEKQRKDRHSIPAKIAGPVKTREDWERIKAERLKPTLEGRLPENWDTLLREYERRDYPLFGLNCEHWLRLVDLVGLEPALTMFYDDPELMHDILRDLTDFWLALSDQVLSMVVPDSCTVGGDFCYKCGPMMSPAAFREFLLPEMSALCSLWRERGVASIVMHTDGDCRELIPLFLEAGVTTVHPFEVTNGQNIVDIRKAHPSLVVTGGIDKKAIAAGKESIDAELESKIPFMLRHGGYIPYIDHAVTPDISWDNFRYYRRRLAELVEEERRGR